MNNYTFNVCGSKRTVDLDKLKIKTCPYCKKDLKLKWFSDPNDPEEEGYVCSACGMFLDVELEEAAKNS